MTDRDAYKGFTKKQIESITDSFSMIYIRLKSFEDLIEDSNDDKYEKMTKNQLILLCKILRSRNENNLKSIEKTLNQCKNEFLKEGTYNEKN